MNPKNNKPQTIDGWIFDAYPEECGMRLWIITPEGKALSFTDAWQPYFYAGSQFDRVRKILRSKSYLLSYRLYERSEVFSGRPLTVLQIRLPQKHIGALTRELQHHRVRLFDTDLHPVQAYHYDRHHFPLARCRFVVADGRLRDWQLNDDPWAPDYALPPLRYLHLALSGSEVGGRIDPNHGPKGSLTLTWDGMTHVLEGRPQDQLQSLIRCLRDWDPDVITSEWGDSLILPELDRWARRCRMPIPFSRDPAKHLAGRGNRSFFTYGRTVYQSGIKYLFGRWHLDVENSFFIRECGKTGLFEMARIAQIPVQRAARCTIGTSLTSMQMSQARRRGILIPSDKQQMENFRPAEGLVIADKGGLVYEPEIGWYENVAEYDFVSMYPTLMTQHNISPETVNCPCCAHNQVPEIGHHLCTRRRGIVPEVLEPILTKRLHYKQAVRRGHANAEAYRKRATAFKWVLVCCFGYLGFKNARFGKIESHESVTAWGREVLLRAKEVAERRGLRMLHANVDAIYVQCQSDTDTEALRLEIERAAGCPVGLEGIYKWIRFCPSRTDPHSGVPNKYFGAFVNDELKIRGIALRRRDTPRLFKNLQNQMLERLNQASGLEECRRATEDLRLIVAEYRERLQSGQVTAQELAITFHLSKDPDQYVHDTLSSLAAKKLAAAGIKLHAGESVQYVISSAKDKVKDWRAVPLALMECLDYDVVKYCELMDRAVAEILDIETHVENNKSEPKTGTFIQLQLAW